MASRTVMIYGLRRTYQRPRIDFGLEVPTHECERLIALWGAVPDNEAALTGWLYLLRHENEEAQRIADMMPQEGA